MPFTKRATLLLSHSIALFSRPFSMWMIFFHSSFLPVHTIYTKKKDRNGGKCLVELISPFRTKVFFSLLSLSPSLSLLLFSRVGGKHFSEWATHKFCHLSRAHILESSSFFQKRFIVFLYSTLCTLWMKSEEEGRWRLRWRERER